MSTENYEDIRKIWKALRHGMHYGMGAQLLDAKLRDMEARVYCNYVQMEFRHVLTNNQYDITGLMLAKIYAQAKKQAYLMRTQQMLPLTFFNGGKYL